jgi:4a-hydroxytetrahydrobiopterin dehydratase
VSRILTEMMRDYFERPQQTDPMGVMLGRSLPHQSSDLPVLPRAVDGKWSVESSPRRLTCTYKFEDPRGMSDFLTEVFAHEAETGHHARITCEFPKVTIEVRTHDLDDVTELDQHYASVCDQVYDDVQHYRSSPVYDLRGDGSDEDFGW